MKNTTTPIVPGVYYHIYNRGNNHENLFIEERNYSYFLNLYAKHIGPIAETHAYCLLRNHFHLLVKIKTEEEFARQTSQVLQTSQVSKTCEVSILKREDVLEFFGGTMAFEEFHQGKVDEKKLTELIDGEFEAGLV